MFQMPAIIIAAVLTPAVAVADPPPAANGRIMVFKEGKYITLTPEGKQLEEFAPKLGTRVIGAGSKKPKEMPFRDKFVVLMPDGKHIEVQFPDRKDLEDPAISPDGKHIAFIAHDFPVRLDRDFNFHRSVFVWDVKSSRGFLLPIIAQNLAWSPDGKLLAIEAASAKEIRAQDFTTWLVDIGTKEKTEIKTPANAHVYAATPDGNSFIATIYDAAEKKLVLAAINRNDNKITRLTTLSGGPLTPIQWTRPIMSPDGSRFLFFDSDKEEKLAKGMQRFPRLYVYDLKTNQRERLAEVPLDALIWDTPAWSPDSKKVAYVWKRTEPGAALGSAIDKNGKIVTRGFDGKPVDESKRNLETETHLNVADADGKNPRTILSAKAPSGARVSLFKLSWR